MNDHALGLLGLLGFTVAYILLLIFCEIINRKLKVDVEYTRKLSHVAAVFAALIFFPIVFKNVGYALALAALFFVLLVIANVQKWIPSVDGVDRKTGGSYFLAFGLGATYFVTYGLFNNHTAFTLALLIFAISDPLAGIVGAKWIKSPTIYGGKTIAGSLTFLFSALIICLVLFSCYEKIDHPMTVSLMIALTATVTELISTRGTDNFTVPLVVAGMLILYNLLIV
jgi:dolichol kinase